MTPSPHGIDTLTGTGDDTGGERRGPTRRQALAMAGGTAAVVGASIGPFSGLLSAGAADGDGEDDGGQISPETRTATWLVGIEMAAAELYTDAREDATFDAAARDLAERCAVHHTAQAAALREMVTAGGGTPPDAANDAFLARYRPGLGEGDAAAKAGHLADIENGFAATYLAAFDVLTSTSLAALAAQILATDAAHSLAWSSVVGEGGLPGEDAIPEVLTTTGAFDENALQPTPPPPEDAEDADTPTSVESDESDGGGDNDTTATEDADEGISTGGDS